MITSLVLACGVMLGAAIQRRGLRGFLRTAFDAIERLTLRLFARFWHGLEEPIGELPPARGAAIFIANHASHADPAFLVGASRRALRFLQASECYHVPILRRLFRMAGCIPVRREGSDVAAIRAALRRLRQGDALCIFPEGEVRSAGRDKLGDCKTGPALLALRSGAPVYPAWIDGGPESTRLLKAWLWPSRRVRVIFGPAIDLAPYRGRPINHALLREMTDHFARSILALRPAQHPASFPVSTPAVSAGRVS